MEPSSAARFVALMLSVYSTMKCGTGLIMAYAAAKEDTTLPEPVWAERLRSRHTRYSTARQRLTEGVSMALLASLLGASSAVGRPAVDRTGLQG
jgi:hypothetical protein